MTSGNEEGYKELEMQEDVLVLTASQVKLVDLNLILNSTGSQCS